MKPIIQMQVLRHLFTQKASMKTETGERWNDIKLHEKEKKIETLEPYIRHAVPKNLEKIEKLFYLSAWRCCAGYGFAEMKLWVREWGELIDPFHFVLWTWGTDGPLSPKQKGPSEPKIQTKRPKGFLFFIFWSQPKKSITCITVIPHEITVWLIYIKQGLLAIIILLKFSNTILTY